MHPARRLTRREFPAVTSCRHDCSGEIGFAVLGRRSGLQEEVLHASRAEEHVHVAPSRSRPRRCESSRPRWRADGRAETSPPADDRRACGVRRWFLRHQGESRCELHQASIRRERPSPSHDDTARPSGKEAYPLCSETQDQGERIVHGSKLIGVEASSGTAEALRIDDGGLLDEDARFLPVKRDLRPERGWTGACRRWRDEGRAQADELIGLNDDRMACAPLFAPACASRRRQAEYLTANHFSRAIPARGQSSVRG